MLKNNKNKTDLLIGALVGGLLGGVAALFLAPTSGSKLRKNVGGAYSCIGQSLVNRLSGKPKNESSNAALIWGGVSAGVAAGLATFLLTTKQGDNLRKGILDTYDDVSEKTVNYVENGSQRLRDLVSGLTSYGACGRNKRQRLQGSKRK